MRGWPLGLEAGRLLFDDSEETALERCKGGVAARDELYRWRCELSARRRDCGLNVRAACDAHAAGVGDTEAVLVASSLETKHAMLSHGPCTAYKTLD